MARLDQTCFSSNAFKLKGKRYLKSGHFFKDEVIQRKEKRQYKKRKHKSDMRSGLDDGSGMRSGATGLSGSRGNRNVLGSGLDSLASSDEDFPLPHSSHVNQSLLHRDEDIGDSSTTTVASSADEGLYSFRRTKHSVYLPVSRSLELKIQRLQIKQRYLLFYVVYM